jgi:L-ascorbate metabolism protein UlaG (beta-lactamase superfamily)
MKPISTEEEAMDKSARELRNWANVASAEEAMRRMGATLCIPMHYGMMIGGRRAGRRFVEQVGERGLELGRARPYGGSRLP